MANINETDDWASGVYQYAIGDVIDGGPESSETLPVRQLANRSLYQRLRNITEWDSVLANVFGYTAGACVIHEGVSWRSRVLNSVEPGMDANKWERWGFTEDDLKILLAALSLNVAGPQELTDAEREQAHVNLQLPPQEFLVKNCDQRVITASSTMLQMPLNGGADSFIGDIGREGNEVTVGRSGMYQITCTAAILTTTIGAPSFGLYVYVNGVADPLLRVSYHNPMNDAAAGRAYLPSLSGCRRLNAGDKLTVYGFQTIGGAGLTAKVEGLGIVRVSR